MTKPTRSGLTDFFGVVRERIERKQYNIPVTHQFPEHRQIGDKVGNLRDMINLLIFRKNWCR